LLFLGRSSTSALIATNLTYDTSKLTTEYHPQVSSRIYDVNGDKIANVFENRHRFYAPFDEIPPRMVEALLAIEDTSFFEHGGINYDAIMRAVIKNVKAMAMVEGASTLTQQLVKNTLLTREKKISRKIKKLILSYKIRVRADQGRDPGAVFQRDLSGTQLLRGQNGSRRLFQ